MSPALDEPSNEDLLRELGKQALILTKISDQIADLRADIQQVQPPQRTVPQSLAGSFLASQWHRRDGDRYAWANGQPDPKMPDKK